MVRKGEKQMHEGAVMQTVVTTILRELAKAQGVRATHIQLELGTSEHFTEEAVRQYFQVLIRDTPVEGAELELVWLPAIYQCLSCAQRFQSTASPGICAQCGDIGLEVEHQDGCTLRAMDVVPSDAEVM
jgi:hydrogenase nickel incorporation protein HypA/HybF